MRHYDGGIFFSRAPCVARHRHGFRRRRRLKSSRSSKYCRIARRRRFPRGARQSARPLYARRPPRISLSVTNMSPGGMVLIAPSRHRMSGYAISIIRPLEGVMRSFRKRLAMTIVATCARRQLAAQLTWPPTALLNCRKTASRRSRPKNQRHAIRPNGIMSLSRDRLVADRRRGDRHRSSAGNRSR